MGKFTNWNWKELSLIFVFTSIFVVGKTQTNFKNNNHLLFLIQLHSVDGDSIMFSTVEIYMLQNIPEINLIDTLGRRIKDKPNNELFCKRGFKNGVLKKGFKKNDIGKLFFVSTTGLPSDISEFGCITFLWKEKTKKVDVKNLFILSRCGD